MHLLWRRYSRSGYAPPWFYIAMAVAFVALAAWAIAARDWTVAAVAGAMVVVVIAGRAFMQRLSIAHDASMRDAHARGGDDDR
jgi:hypothetical protein